MIVIERTLTVAANPAAAFGYLRDFAHTEEWVRAAARTVRNGTGPIVPGASWRQSRRVLGITAELAYTLIEETPGRLVFHGRNEGATCTDVVFVRPLATGAEITYRVELELHGLAKLASPLVKIEFEKLGTESAAGLVQALSRLTPQAWHPTTLPPPAPA